MKTLSRQISFIAGLWCFAMAIAQASFWVSFMLYVAAIVIAVIVVREWKD